MTLQFPPELEAKLSRLAAETGARSIKLRSTFWQPHSTMTSGFREVEKGRGDARDGRLIDHEEVATRIDCRCRG